MLISLAVIIPQSLVVYALDGLRRGRDISRTKSPSASLKGVGTAQGPDGRRDGSLRFYGRRNSYVEIPNTGKMDVRYSITILIWVYHEGVSGPIFNYNPRGFGVHLWMTGRRQLFARFVRRSRRFTRPVVSGRMKYKAWNYVGATYDRRTGIATLYINSIPVAYRRIGRIQLSTNYPVRLGARIGDRRYFRGRLFCAQVFSRALNKKQIFQAKRRCFLPGLRLLCSVYNYSKLKLNRKRGLKNFRFAQFISSAALI